MKQAPTKKSLMMVVAILLASLSQLTAAQSQVLQPADLTGAWYDPSASGQGFMIDISPNSDGSANIFGGWFTFTLEGALNEAYPAWFSLQGKVSFADAPTYLGIFHTEGGVFDSGPKVSATNVGQGNLTFVDCTHASFTYSVSGQPLNSDRSSVSGAISLVRLSSDAGCGQSVSAQKSSRGYSGTWYNPATSGQGLLFDVSATNGGFFFGGWFTYASNSPTSQQWYTLQGPFGTSSSEGDVPIFIAKTETFGSADPPQNGEQTTHQVGTAHIKFTSCTDAQLDYNVSQGGGAAGSIPLKRLTPIADDCLQ